MSALAMYYIAFGTMPDEIFGALILCPISIIAAILQDVITDWWRTKNEH